MFDNVSGEARSGQVSVVIPTHLRHNMLPDAIDSALRQAETREVIVVDDARDVDLEELLSGRFTDQPVRLLHNSGAGPASSRNLGAGAAEGQFLAFLDDDDIWEGGYLARALTRMRQEGTDVVFTSWDGHPLRAPLRAKDVAVRNPGVGGSNMVMKTEVFGGLGGFDDRLWIGEDKDFLVRLLLADIPHSVEPTAGFVRRLTDQGHITTVPSPRHIRSMVTYRQKHRHHLTLRQRSGLLAWEIAQRRHMTESRFLRCCYFAASVLLATGEPQDLLTRLKWRRVRRARGLETVGERPVA
jgi:glycosyltransferase involved in cell wall biosynthesis